ncbi:MAG TPA: hypothetical protein VF898_10565 [Chloroflexota bacterium]
MATDFIADPISREEIDELARKLHVWAGQLSPREHAMLLLVAARAAGDVAGAGSATGGVAYDIIEPVNPPPDTILLDVIAAVYSALKSLLDSLS